LAIFLQQFQADKRVHDCAQTPRGRASFFFELLNRLRAARQRIKNFVVYGRADDQRRGISKSELLEALGRELFRFALFHR
jgi:hypothetical protein